MSWLVIPTAPEYEAHPCGDVRRMSSTKILKPYPNSAGYLTVDLRLSSTRSQQMIHRIICLTFNGPPPFPNALVRHLDGNKYNNTPANLAWGTFHENAADNVKHQKEKRTMSSPQKNKGSAYEREVADFMTQQLGIDVRRTPLSGSFSFVPGSGSADLTGTPDLWCELKRVERFNVHDAMAQAKRGCFAHNNTDMPVVITRRNRQSLPQSLCTMELADFLKIYNGYLKSIGVRTTQASPAATMTTQQPEGNPQL